MYAAAQICTGGSNIIWVKTNAGAYLSPGAPRQDFHSDEQGHGTSSSFVVGVRASALASSVEDAFAGDSAEKAGSLGRDGGAKPLHRLSARSNPEGD